MNKQYDILILGSGPAGIHAAVAGAQHGASAALVDMARTPGGRVLKTTEDGRELAHTTGAELNSAKNLESLFKSHSSKFDFFSGSTIVDLVDRQAVIDGSRGQMTLAGRKVILAPGALETPAVFKNWTTPGIYTLGGYNNMIKRGHKLPRSVLAAGSGPLLYAVAANISKSGGKLAGLLDAASFSQNAGLACTLLRGRYFGKIGVAAKAFAALTGTKWKRRCRISAVEGQAGNFTVHTAYMDDNWKTVNAGPVFKTEAVAVSYGLHPNTDLARRCECAHSYDPVTGTWTTTVDDFMRTSVPGIYLAGDGVEIKGYEGAANDGRLAGLSAVVDLGLGGSLDQEIRDLQKKRRECRAFAAVLSACSEPGNGYFAELTDDLVICRCENITVKRIRSALAEGASDRNGIKKRTRLGMGHCQGRYCGQVIDKILAGFAASAHVPAMFGPRTPIMPVRMGVLAGLQLPVDDEFRS
jgi:thioredoxin reductase/bacterioferritin-associated ferredoxin